MGRHSRKNKQPNAPKWSKRWLQAFRETVETPNGPHEFALLASNRLYWVTPSGAWRRVREAE